MAVEVQGRRLTIVNLDKVLYPAEGFTKGEVLDYYSRIAPTMLSHLIGRPLTFKRYPDGVDGKFFFEKNIPSHAPSWVRRVRLRAPGSTKERETIDYAIVDDLPTLVWTANLATLELHVPMWRVDDEGNELDPDLLVFDLDPGEPADIVDCCRVARLVREVLADDDLVGYPKTSGSKGMQLYVPLRPTRPWQDVHTYARKLAERLEREHRDLVVSRMAKQARRDKVFVDWSQNHHGKTTIAPYSLRARPRPTVSTPLTWDEVEECAESGDPDLLVFEAGEVLDRVAEHGDLYAGVLKAERRLP